MAYDTLIQLGTAIFTFCLLLVAYFNLKGLNRSQLIQAHMNLINLENSIRKNRVNLKFLSKKYADAIDVNTEQELDVQAIKRLEEERNNAFELYIASADKLASLINTRYLQKQFNKRNWEDEYYEIFKEVKDYCDGYSGNIPGKDNMIKNLNEMLSQWGN